jgi:transposase-like protein
MDVERQWCDQRWCADFSKMDAGNIKVHSYVERRFYCVRCLHTFSADKGTVFESLRSERDEVLHALTLLVERNSLRAVERATPHPADTVLYWLDLAGQHCAALSTYLIHDVQLRQAQIDELWTFVKKNKLIVCRLTRPKWAIRGSGVQSLCRVVYAL